jgi:membrane protease subunit HflC
MNRLVSYIIAGVIALTILMSTLFVVDQRQFAIVFALGEVKQVIKDPGLHFKLPPPFQNVIFLDKRILTLDTPEADRFITAEKKNILVDAYVKWRIVDPRLYFISFGGDERRAQDRMAQIVKAALNEEITKRTVREVISGERGKVMDAIAAKVTEEVKQIGGQIVDVRLKRVDYVEQINNSVYERMKSERARVANELRSTGAAESEKIRADADRQRIVIIAEAYRQAEGIRGEGDAKAARIYAQAFGQNPEFYKTQAMRLPVWDKPRIIACAEDHPEHIGLPRGCLEETLDLLKALKIRVELRDERFEGKQLDLAFSGELRPEQQKAAAAMLKHDCGVLAATTAFGKTVLAAWLIAKRGVNTLILVHRQQLMEQWVERLPTPEAF